MHECAILVERDMGKHNSHLPKNDSNKTVGHGAQPASPKVLQRLARGQAMTAKTAAKQPKEKK